MLQEHLMGCLEDRQGNADLITSLLPAIQVFV